MGTRGTFAARTVRRSIPNARRGRVRVEAVEPRRLLAVTLTGGALVITGTPGDDVVFVGPGASPGEVAVDFNFATQTFAASSITSIAISLGDGLDSVDVSDALSQGLPAPLIDTGAGRDALSLTRIAGGTLVGGDGDDVFVANEVPIAGVTIDAGAGVDSFTFRPTAAAVVSYAMPAGLENLSAQGTGGTIVGNALDNVIRFGGAGATRVDGGDGDDRIAPFADATFADGGVTLVGGAGDDTLYGGDGDDALLGGGGRDRVWGRAGDDRLDGGGSNDVLRGEAGRDAAYGRDGDDSLDGGAGHDRLDGGAGDDRLAGGRGRDTLYGGPGDDVGDRDDDDRIVREIESLR